MVSEEKINKLEEKFDELIELLKFIIHVNDGINVKQANWILEQLDNLQED